MATKEQRILGYSVPQGFRSLLTHTCAYFDWLSEPGVYCIPCSWRIRNRRHMVDLLTGPISTGTAFIADMSSFVHASTHANLDLSLLCPGKTATAGAGRDGTGQRSPLNTVPMSINSGKRRYTAPPSLAPSVDTQNGHINTKNPYRSKQQGFIGQLFGCKYRGLRSVYALGVCIVVFNHFGMNVYRVRRRFHAPLPRIMPDVSILG